VKYATWTMPAGTETWGSVIDDEVVDAAVALPLVGLPPVASLGDLIASGDRSLWDRVADALSSGPRTNGLAEVTLSAPYRPRGTIFAAGANYADHAEEARKAGALDGLPDRPVIFAKALSSVCGPDADIELWPELTQELDYEVELGAVLGIGGRAVSSESALDHVFGYTVVNDISARDVQQGRPGGQWFLGKSMDTFCPIGPWIVTADEIADPHSLDITLTLNGELRQKSDTSFLLFSVDELICEISKYATLSPGDLIATGTPAGVGASAAPPRFLKDGDLLEAAVDGIGTLRSRIVRR
jgi:2-keto-4-pentenoate hydratase/2-oxohepta-3-ene-1,7-dioic acid hydratase in catechol pathway